MYIINFIVLAQCQNKTVNQKVNLCNYDPKFT